MSDQVSSQVLQIYLDMSDFKDERKFCQGMQYTYSNDQAP